MATADSIMASMPGRYAGALFGLANEQGELAKVESDLDTFQAIYEASDDFKRLVKSPVFSSDEQQKALQAVLKTTDIGGLASNFFLLIAKNRRLSAATDIIKAFKALSADARGEITAQVTSAIPLSEAQIASLKETLKSAIGKDVDLDTTVEPEILGGLIVKFGSRMVDSSLRTKLNNMKMGLKTSS